MKADPIPDVLQGVVDAFAASMHAKPGKKNRSESQRRRGMSLKLLRGKWVVRWRTRDAKGKRRRPSKVIGDACQFKTRAAAWREVDRLRPYLIERNYSAGESPHWEEVVRDYIARELVLKSKGSQLQIGYVIRNHLQPAFAGLRLHEIDRGQQQVFVSNQSRDGAARETIRARYGHLRTILTWALSRGLAAKLPRPREVKMPRAPTIESTPREKAYTDAEFEQILAATVPPLRALYGVMGHAGLRISEALGLSWDHVDLDQGARTADGARGTLRIRQSGGRGCIVPLKSRSSTRDVAISSELARLLVEHREACGGVGLLFPGENGNPLWSSGIMANYFDPLLRRLGIKSKQRGFHGLRHRFASRLADEGTPLKAIMRICGHSTLAAAEVYQTTSTQVERAAVARLSIKEQSPEIDPPAVSEAKRPEVPAAAAPDDHSLN